jgi:hypothetical protein
MGRKANATGPENKTFRLALSAKQKSISILQVEFLKRRSLRGRDIPAPARSKRMKLIRGEGGRGLG